MEIKNKPPNDSYSLLIMLARAWNQLKPDIIEPVLCPDVVYSSSWLNYTIIGRSNYISYLTEKFAAIRSTGGEAVTKARMAFLTGSQVEHCVLLTQISGSEIRQMLFFIQVKNNQILRIYAGEPANYTQLQLTGVYP